MASSRTKKDGFQKKCLNHSIALLQQSSDKRDAQLFHYFGYKKSIEKFQIYQKKRAFTKVFSKVNFFKVCNKFIITNVQLYLKIKYLQNSNACHHSPKISEASGANLNTHKGK